MHVARMSSCPINELGNIKVEYDNRDGIKGTFTCTGDPGKLLPAIWKSRTYEQLVKNVTKLCPDAVFSPDAVFTDKAT